MLRTHTCTNCNIQVYHLTRLHFLPFLQALYNPSVYSFLWRVFFVHNVMQCPAVMSQIRWYWSKRLYNTTKSLQIQDHMHGLYGIHKINRKYRTKDVDLYTKIVVYYSSCTRGSVLQQYAGPQVLLHLLHTVTIQLAKVLDSHGANGVILQCKEK